MKPPEGASASASEFKQNIQEKIGEKALEENNIQSEGFVVEEKEKKKERFNKKDLDFKTFKQQVLDKKAEIEKIEAKGGWAGKYLIYKNKHPELNWPSSPDSSYIKDGWRGFPSLFGEEVKERFKKEDLDFETFKKQVLERKEEIEKIELNQGWAGKYLIYKNNHPELNWPATPEKSYKKNGWRGLLELFNEETFNKEELDFETFKKQVLERKEEIEKIEAKGGWAGKYRIYENKHPELNWPSSPNISYEKNGWQGFPALFGEEVKERFKKEDLDFETFKKQVLERKEVIEKIEAKGGWGGKYLIYKNNHPELNWPATPEKSYKKNGWRGLPELFNEETFKKEDLDFETFKKQVLERKEVIEKIEAKGGWGGKYLIYKNNHPELNWPSSPNISYEKNGWQGFPALFGEEVKERFKKEDLDFETFKKQVLERKEEIEKIEAKGGWAGKYLIYKNKHPELNWPSSPDSSYIKDGWRGFPELFGEINRLKEFLIEKEKQELENQKSEQLENFCKDKEQNRDSIRELLDVMQIYGASKCVDILYKFHPEFRDLPQEKVKKIIGKYLGDFMMSRGSLDYNFHKTAAEFLSDLDFRNAAKEFFKDNCYRKLIKLKKTGYIKEEALMDIIREYRLSFEDIKINKEILQDIILEVEKYYQDIFDFDKPERFVDELKEGVSFPSLNQKINVKELEEKKSLLIADKMGTGKSASVLMAKEYLRVNKCLLMVPSNVLETWKGYLSDDPKQKGCYKKDQAPKTLFLENPKDLEKLHDDQWEYVVISLEKMKESYLDPLKKIGFEMVVVDEIHKLKNPKGFRAQKLFDFIGEKENQNQYFCALSGTPAPNKVKDFAVSIKSLYADNKKIANMDIKDLTYNIIKGHQVDLRSMLMPKMQMKEMSESLEMSEKEEIIEELEMTENEKIIYNNILDNDELTASEKIITLRKFLLNPELFIKTDQKFEGSKVKKLKSLLREKFLVENESRVIVFVNDYIDGVIRDDEQGKSIIDKLGLPKDIKILSVHGENEKDRSEIQKEFNNRETKGEEKILLLVSGQTADVGVDYTGADSLIVYNEPWSEYDLQQQIARVYRPGLDHDLNVHRLVVQDSIEKGIHDYIKLKQKAIEKVLQGIPRNELEEQILIEDAGGDDLVKINNTLADKYLSRQDRQTKRFGYCAELGEEGFVKEVISTKHGPEYAENYHEMGRRSYQSNLNRVSGTIIKELCRLDKQKANEIKIADFGSGPEMLRRHIGEDYQNNVYSLDINPAHFDYCNPEDKNKKWFEGSIKNSPFKDKEFDYLNVSAAFHYTESLNYGKGTTERLETLVEMNRVLKEGGTALLNMVYVYRFRNMDDFETAIKNFGFEVMKNFTGEMSQENNFSSNLITLKKTGDIKLSLDEILEKMTKNERDSFKLRRQDKKLANTLDIIREFNIGDKKLKIDFNKEDRGAFQEEQEIKLQAEKLKLKYGGIANIPSEEAENMGFWITFYNNRYVLMKKMEKNRGVVYIKEKNKK